MYNDEREVTANSILTAMRKIKSKLPRWSEEKLNWAFFVIIHSHNQKNFKSPSIKIADTIRLLTETYHIEQLSSKDIPKLVLFEQHASSFLNKVSSNHITSTLLLHIDYMIADIIKINPIHCKIVASLIGEIVYDGRAKLIDTYPNTGEASAKQGMATRPGISTDNFSFPMIHGNTQPQKTLLELKFKELNLSANFLGLQHTGLNSSATNIYLIDPPDEQFWNTELSNIKPNRSGFLTVKQFASNSTSGTYIYIFKFEDAPQRQHNADMRALLNLNLTIQARISFTSVDYDKKIQKYIALFIQPDDITKKNNFLDIDITRENKNIEGLDALERSVLAGLIYKKWLGARRQAMQPIPDLVKRISDNLFEDGFKNVENLCISFDYDTKAELLLILTQKKRPASAPFDSQPSISINSSPITLILKKQKKQTIYVIGNNGAGKSLLLKDIANSLSIVENPVVGISTSIHDRFPFEMPSSLKSFVYKGLKTSNKAVTMEKIEREASISVINIFKNQVLLDAFLRAMDCLEYRTSYFLAPNQSKNESRRKDLIPLSSIASENQEALINIRTAGYQLGVVKSKDTHRITTFSELSSGEQSIIMLTTKIIDSHKPDTVYLIDEPENSLHVRWQQRLPEMLSRLSEELSCSFIVATHSPILIANSKSTSPCFGMNNGQLKEISLESKQSVETILMEGFETYTPYNKQVQEQCAKLVASAIRAANEVPSNIESIAPNSIRELKRLEEIIKLTGNKQAEARQESDEQLISTAMAAILALAEKRAIHNV